MKTRHNAIHTLVVIILCLCFGVNEARAQDIIDIKGRVMVVNQCLDRKDTVYMSTYFKLFSNIKKAEEVKVQLDSLKYESLTKEKFRDKCRGLGIIRRTKTYGYFRTTAFPGMALLFVTPNGDTVITPIVDDKTEYKVIINTFHLAFKGRIMK